ncbi:PAAR domain-containing protein [Candidatus Caldatribacterium sp.]|uniref:PAAR domain-containing protein n=1 Tax=Candidatus Caldatribacterium sp. TaxID=2282143 RepID=UPI00383E771D|nr:PAAR domain-containing protein [Candidatus Caldatribacterium sp.]
MPGAAYVTCQTLCWNTVPLPGGGTACQSVPNHITSGVPTVLVHGFPIAVVSSTTSHPCTVTQGSATVLAGGRSVARIGDLLSCRCLSNRGIIATGSVTVLVG